MLGQKAEHTCCRLGSEDGCQHPGLLGGLSSLPVAILLTYLLLLRIPLPENSACKGRCFPESWPGG